MTRRLSIRATTQGLVAAFVLACAARAPAQDAPLFVARQYAAGLESNGLAVGDLNGDGVPDLATSDRGIVPLTSTVSVLLGDGTGAFAAPVTYPAGKLPSWVAMADVDDDGALDLLVANTVSNDVSVMLGDGTGGFGPTASFAAGAKPRCVVSADLDGDGDEDLAVANEQSDDVSILRGDGRGGFAAPTAHAAGIEARHLVAADLDGDGDEDLAVVCDEPDSVVVLWNDGSGDFSAPMSLIGDMRLWRVAAGDVDLDGTIDLVVDGYHVPGASMKVVTILRGDGTGGFAAPEDLSNLAGGSVSIGDVDGDGWPDLMASAAELTLFRGDGLGGFTTPTSWHSGYDGGVAVLADLDGDGDLDVAHSDKSKVSVLMNDGAGEFAVPPVLPLDGWVRDVALGDLDGDGRLEIVTAAPPGVVVHRGLGGGTFAAPTTMDLGGSAGALAVGDLDGDGDLDVAAAVNWGGLSPGSLAVLLNDGRGGLVVAQVLEIDTAPGSIAIGDMDADGAPDLVVAHEISDNVWILHGDGTGSFGSPTSLYAGDMPWDVAVGDLNHDGLLDIVSTSYAFGQVFVHLANEHGTITYLGPTTYSAGVETKGLALADIDADGHLDLVYCWQNAASVRLGNGTGTFGAAINLGVTGFSVDAISVADFDADGHDDLVVAHALGNNVAVLRGDGTGHAQAPEHYLAGNGPTTLAVGDLDGDARPDLVVGNFSTNDLTLHVNLAKWADLGSGLAGGAAGGSVPVLGGSGTLQPGSAGAITLDKTVPVAPVLLFASLVSTPAPFKGGTLVPVPWLLALPLATQAGNVELAWASWPGGVPPSSSLYFQFAIPDPDAPQGVALSNALTVETP